MVLDGADACDVVGAACGVGVLLSSTAVVFGAGCQGDCGLSCQKQNMDERLTRGKDRRQKGEHKFSMYEGAVFAARLQVPHCRVNMAR